MKKSNLVTFSFPSLMMILMSVISFTDILSFSDIDLKGLFIISLQSVDKSTLFSFLGKINLGGDKYVN